MVNQYQQGQNSGQRGLIYANICVTTQQTTSTKNNYQYMNAGNRITVRGNSGYGFKLKCKYFTIADYIP